MLASLSPARTSGLLALLAVLLVGVGVAPAHAASSSAASRSAAAFDRVGGGQFDLDRGALETVLDAAPAERSRTTPLVVSVPTPEGGFERFAVREAPVMEPALAAKHPEIRTYAGRGIDTEGADVRLSLTPLGFHAAVRSPERSWYVDPRPTGDAARHVAYERSDLQDRNGDFVERELPGLTEQVQQAAARAPGSTVQLRTYRLALVSDPTYATNSNANGNTLAAKAVLMNRVNQLYEADLAIRMVLIDATPKLNLDTAALATGANGPCGAEGCFTDAQLAGCTSALLDRNSVVTGLLAGARNFDIGHIVLGKPGGGIAGLGVVGDVSKSQGCTGIPKPVGDFFAVDYVAHEMGHQFAGNHTFDGFQKNCSTSNRNPGTSVEPGSGTTVMAYAGICAQDDLQPHSDPYFSQRSIDEITAYTGSALAANASEQPAVLRGFDGTDSFRLSYAGAKTAPIVNGLLTYNDLAIQQAINAILPAGRSVTVSNTGATGFTVTFDQAVPVEQLVMTDQTGFTGFVGETVAGGPPTNGGVATPTVNKAPGVKTAAGFTIPLRTPFALSATGTDADGDPLTYLWEQNDVGANQAFGTPLTVNTKTTGPLFRVFGTAARYADPNDAYLSPSPGENVATAEASRAFPDVQQVIADNTNAATGSCPTVNQRVEDPVQGTVLSPGDPVTPAVQDCYSEYLPTTGYTGDGSGAMHFRVTVRDNKPGGGGTGHADTTLTLGTNSAPFRITSPASPTTASGGATLPVTWDVAGTNAAPYNAANVRITFSTDGGATFPTVLAAATPNDGKETVAVPNVATTQGRVKIEAIGNVFYDASRGAVTVVKTDPPAAPAADTTTPPAAAPTTPTTPATTSAPPKSAPVTAAEAAQSTAATALGDKTPVLLGTLGRLRLFATSRGSSLGRPEVLRRLLVGVCTSGTCDVKAKATLSTRTTRTGKVTRRTLTLPSLRIHAGRAGSVVLRLTRSQRATIRRARSATLRLVLTSGGRSYVRTYRFRVGKA